MDLLSRSLFAAVLLAFIQTAAAGQVYKWVDKDGKYHFSDTPQAGWTRVEANHGNSMTAEVPTTAGTDADSDKKAELCQQKKKELASYRNSSQIIERDPLGGERQYSDEQKQKLIALTQQKVQEACGDDGDGGSQ